MKSARTWVIAAQTLALAAALALGVGAGLTYAKLPPLSDEAKAKAVEAKAKAAETAKMEADQLAKSQDRVAERYKKGQGIKTAAAAPAKKK